MNHSDTSQDSIQSQDNKPKQVQFVGQLKNINYKLYPKEFQKKIDNYFKEQFGEFEVKCVSFKYNNKSNSNNSQEYSLQKLEKLSQILEDKQIYSEDGYNIINKDLDIYQELQQYQINNGSNPNFDKIKKELEKNNYQQIKTDEKNFIEQKLIKLSEMQFQYKQLNNSYSELSESREKISQSQQAVQGEFKLIGRDIKGIIKKFKSLEKQPGSGIELKDDKNKPQYLHLKDVNDVDQNQLEYKEVLENNKKFIFDCSNVSLGVLNLEAEKQTQKQLKFYEYFSFKVLQSPQNTTQFHIYPHIDSKKKKVQIIFEIDDCELKIEWSLKSCNKVVYLEKTSSNEQKELYFDMLHPPQYYIYRVGTSQYQSNIAYDNQFNRIFNFPVLLNETVLSNFQQLIYQNKDSIKFQDLKYNEFKRLFLVNNTAIKLQIQTPTDQEQKNFEQFLEKLNNFKLLKKIENKCKDKDKNKDKDKDEDKNEDKNENKDKDKDITLQIDELKFLSYDEYQEKIYKIDNFQISYLLLVYFSDDLYKVDKQETSYKKLNEAIDFIISLKDDEDKMKLIERALNKIIQQRQTLSKEILEKQLKQTQNLDNIVNNNSHIYYIRRIKLTPSGILYEKKEPEVQNRLTRKEQNNQDFMLRVSLIDDNNKNLMSNKYLLNEYFRKFLSKTQILDRVYKGLCWSASQQRANSLWFFAQNDITKKSHDQIISELGEFDQKFTSAAKMAARIGQSLSASFPVDLGEGLQIYTEDDISVTCINKRKQEVKFDFTDGIGTMSQKVYNKILQELKYENFTAAQIRFGGAKGVITIDRFLSGKQICLRDSQIKYQAKYDIVEVLDKNKYRGGFLNRQIIILLVSLGVKDEVFINLQNEQIKQIKHQDNDSSMYTNLKQYFNPDYSQPQRKYEPLSNLIRKCISAKYNIDNDVYLKNIIKTTQKRAILSLKQRSNIYVKDSARLLGIIDEYGVLEEDEIFCKILDDDVENQYTMDETLMYKEISDFSNHVIVARNPCLHPGDIKKLKTVGSQRLMERLKRKIEIIMDNIKRQNNFQQDYDYLKKNPNQKKEILNKYSRFIKSLIARTDIKQKDSFNNLYNEKQKEEKYFGVAIYFTLEKFSKDKSFNVYKDHYNCVTFPQKGKMPITSQISGSDLDGDLFFISWDKDLIQINEQKPMDYSGSSSTKKQKFNAEDRYDFYIQYIQNDILGMIDNRWLAMADQKQGHALHEDCVSLAEKHSDAVDFVKSGDITRIIDQKFKVKEWPDYMEKKEKFTTYESQTVLGKLYREAKKQWDNCKEDNLEADLNQMKIDPIFLPDKLTIKDPKQMKSIANFFEDFDKSLTGLIILHGIRNEFEFFSGNFSKMQKELRNKKLVNKQPDQQRILDALLDLKIEFTNKYDKLYTSICEDNQQNKIEFAKYIYLYNYLSRNSKKELEMTHEGQKSTLDLIFKYKKLNYNNKQPYFGLTWFLIPDIILEIINSKKPQNLQNLNQIQPQNNHNNLDTSLDDSIHYNNNLKNSQQKLNQPYQKPEAGNLDKIQEENVSQFQSKSCQNLSENVNDISYHEDFKNCQVQCNNSTQDNQEQQQKLQQQKSDEKNNKPNYQEEDSYDEGEI